MYNKEYIVDATGNGARVLVAKCLSLGEADPDFEAIYTDYRTYYAAHSLIKTAPYPGTGAPLSLAAGEGSLLRHRIFKIGAHYNPLFPVCQRMICRKSSQLSATRARGSTASSFSRPRKPQPTPTKSMRQFFAVSMSTSLSPT